MSVEINGTTGVSLVQDGVVTAADLNSTLDLTGKTVTLPSGVGGQLLQFVESKVSSQFTTNSTSPSNIMTASITPVSASSTIYISWFGTYYLPSDSETVFDVYNTTSSSRLQDVYYGHPASGAWFMGTLQGSETSGSTSARTYAARAWKYDSTANTSTIGTGGTDNMTIRIMEIAG